MSRNVGSVVLPEKNNIKIEVRQFVLNIGIGGLIIADEFTFDNVRKCVGAICSYLKTQEAGDGKKVLAGHDLVVCGREVYVRLPQQLRRKRIPRVVMHRANTYAHNIACDPE